MSKRSLVFVAMQRLTVRTLLKVLLANSTAARPLISTGVPTGYILSTLASIAITQLQGQACLHGI